MPTDYRVLGQVLPSANTLTTLYTVPASKQAVVSTITVCNQAATNAAFGICLRPAGASQTTSQYIAMGAVAPANDTIVLTLGLTLTATDVVSVSATTATVSFGCFGSQIT